MNKLRSKSITHTCFNITEKKKRVDDGSLEGIMHFCFLFWIFVLFFNFFHEVILKLEPFFFFF
jgi:hypothetical protein